MRKFALLFTIVLSLGCSQSAKANPGDDLIPLILGGPPVITIVTRLFFRDIDQPFMRRAVGVAVSALAIGAIGESLIRDEKNKEEENKNKPLSFNPGIFAVGATGAAIVYTLSDLGIDLSLAGARKMNWIA